MSSGFIKLFSTSEPAEKAYLLEDGEVFFYLSNVDKYAIRGKNLIFGTTEVILNNILNIPATRIETAVVSAQSGIKTIPAEKLKSGMNTYSFVMNVSIVLAKKVLQTNQIINANMKSISSEDPKRKDDEIEYYQIVSRLKTEWDKRRLPWLKTLFSTFENSLTFKRGEANFRSQEPTRIAVINSLSELDFEYPRGSVICEQDEPGDDMFILRSGSIDVFFAGNRVATVEEPGTVIGEMALLLGEKRSATLKAKNNVVITKINRQYLKDNTSEDNSILSSLACSLAKKHYFNVIKIGDINKSIMEKAATQDQQQPGNSAMLSQKAKVELSQLKSEIIKTIKGKDAGFIKDLTDKF